MKTRRKKKHSIHTKKNPTSNDAVSRYMKKNNTYMTHSLNTKIEFRFINNL